MKTDLITSAHVAAFLTEKLMAAAGRTDSYVNLKASACRHSTGKREIVVTFQGYVEHQSHTAELETAEQAMDALLSMIPSPEKQAERLREQAAMLVSHAEKLEMRSHV
jgi:hypothetical protein